MIHGHEKSDFLLQIYTSHIKKRFWVKIIRSYCDIVDYDNV